MSFYYGIVEDTSDPKELGRVRVRLYGQHSYLTSEIPTSDLPWATVMQPVTSAANSGIGTTPRLLPGTQVVVMFVDDEMQFPIVMGSIATEITKEFMNINDVKIERGDDQYGLQDPNGKYPRGSMVGENDLSQLSKPGTFESHPSFIKRTTDKKRFGTKVTANAPKLDSIEESHEIFEPFTAEVEFDEPSIMGDSEPTVVYPTNQVHETESGMVEEYDDGNIRRHSYHPSGTYQEIVADGSRTLKIVGLGTDIYLDGRNLYIDGDWNITVTGDKRELVQGNYILEVEGNMSVETKKNKQEKVGINSFQEIGANQIEKIAGNRTTAIDQNETLSVGLDRVTSIGEDELRSVVATEDETIGDSATHRYKKNLKETVTEKSTRVTFKDSSYTTGGTAYYSQTNTIFRTKEEESWTVNTGNRTTNIQTGNDTLTVTGNQDITAAITNINNNVNVTGTITASSHISTTGGDVSTSSITLNTHVHSQPNTGANATAQGDTGVGK